MNLLRLINLHYKRMKRGTLAVWYTLHPHCSTLTDSEISIFTYNYHFFNLLRKRGLTLNSPICLPLLCYFPPTPPSFLLRFFTFRFFLCPPLSLLALISLPTGTSGSIFGWWAAGGWKHRVSQRCVFVWVYVCSNWLWCCSPRHHPCFFSVFSWFYCMCVWHQTLLLYGIL